MTVQTDQGTKPQEPGKDEGGKKDEPPATMAEFRSAVAEIVEGALKPLMDRLGDGKPASQDPPANNPAAGSPADLAGMVDAAIAKVLGDKEKQSADDEHRKQHEAIAAAGERRPVERPKRSKWLGNIYDKDA